MQLEPKRPPGRVDRKAGAYASEIVRLRAAGYTYEAIREALAAVGIQLTECTLRREVRRHKQQLTSEAPPVRSLSNVPRATSRPTPETQADLPLPSTSRSGKEIAEAFFNSHPSNPLFPTKEKT